MVLLPNIEVVREQGKGVRVRLENGTLEWIPRSQIKDGANLAVGYRGDLQITKWIAGRLAEAAKQAVLFARCPQCGADVPPLPEPEAV